MQILEDARRRHSEIKRVMNDLHLDMKHLNQASVWNMKTYYFCRALNDTRFIIETTLQVLSDMHHQVDRYQEYDEAEACEKGEAGDACSAEADAEAEALHQEIEKIAHHLKVYANDIEHWQKIYKCSL